jgi:hypothetical protein
MIVEMMRQSADKKWSILHSDPGWLAKHRVSDNVGGVKHFLSTQPHPLEEKRHFALSEEQLPLPTKARA